MFKFTRKVFDAEIYMKSRNVIKLKSVLNLNIDVDSDSKITNMKWTSNHPGNHMLWVDISQVECVKVIRKYRIVGLWWI